MRTITESESTPKADGFYMPAEFAPQDRVWMGWPHRTDTWARGAKPAQAQYAEIARAISRFTPVTMCANQADYANCKAVFEEDENVTVIEMTTDDVWFRDTACTYVINGKGDKRACHWHFNGYGGLIDGLYFPWDKDASLGLQISQIEQVTRYRPDDFILEGGSFNCDGQGTVVTTEMCLLNEGRNPQYTKEQIEELLGEYLGIEKVIWIKDGIDPYETNGHVDDVACFSAPGEVCCMWTDDPDHKFYRECQEAYRVLCEATDARGRKLKVHKVIMPSTSVYMTEVEASTIDLVEGSLPRTPEDAFEPSHLNFLPINGAVLVPQFGDPNDEQALKDIQAAYPDREVIGIMTREIIYGGGNIHCITQQQPKAHRTA
ncbi:agmatine deiminase [Candidatus Collinsella stercoripullorum]|uniref:agmatine deiminase n=1 Tax=Candidatus Collinsella stercoripullorum TaxID=2838522 RepID=UPI0022E7A313|nr:agmatine deiminase [Candidatus Collinsella stercoripullorum]